MEELINRIVAASGVSEEQAREAVAIILKFLNKDGPQEQMQQIFDALPGARELVAEREGKSGGGLLGGLGSMMGGGMAGKKKSAMKKGGMAKKKAVKKRGGGMMKKK